MTSTFPFETMTILGTLVGINRVNYYLGKLVNVHLLELIRVANFIILIQQQNG